MYDLLGATTHRSPDLRFDHADGILNQSAEAVKLFVRDL